MNKLILELTIVMFAASSIGRFITFAWRLSPMKVGILCAVLSGLSFELGLLRGAM